MINGKIVQVRISTSAFGLSRYYEELYRFRDKSGTTLELLVNRQESCTLSNTKKQTSIRLFRSRLHSGMRVAFWNLKECRIGLCSRDLSDRQRGHSLAWIAMLDHQIDAEILRVPILVGNNDLFAIVLIGDGLGLSNSVRGHAFDLANSKVFLLCEFIGRSIPIRSGKADRRWLG